MRCFGMGGVSSFRRVLAKWHSPVRKEAFDVVHLVGWIYFESCCTSESPALRNRCPQMESGPLAVRIRTKSSASKPPKTTKKRMKSKSLKKWLQTIDTSRLSSPTCKIEPRIYETWEICIYILVSQVANLPYDPVAQGLISGIGRPVIYPLPSHKIASTWTNCVCWMHF